jgi:hypothetical protein
MVPMSDILSILALDFVTPGDVPGPEAMRLAARPLARAAETIVRRGGELLVRVGRGGVAAFGDPSGALDTLTELIRADLATPQDAGRIRLRGSLHVGALTDPSPAVAEPAVIAARRLLARAGAGEILVSSPFLETGAAASLQAAPLPALSGEPASSDPPAFRLLFAPADLAERLARRTQISGWALGATLLVVMVAVLGSLALALLL